MAGDSAVGRAPKASSTTRAESPELGDGEPIDLGPVRRQDTMVAEAGAAREGVASQGEEGTVGTSIRSTSGEYVAVLLSISSVLRPACR